MTQITVIGNLTADPELRFTTSDVAVVNFSVAENKRVQKNGEWIDGDPVFHNIVAWRQLAENVAETLSVGNRVIVHGELETSTWEDIDGNRRTKFQINARAIGAELTFATATVSKITRQPEKAEPPAFVTRKGRRS